MFLLILFNSAELFYSIEAVSTDVASFAVIEHETWIFWIGIKMVLKLKFRVRTCGSFI